MKQGKEVQLNVPSIELTPKYADVRQNTEKEKKNPTLCSHCEKKSSSLFTRGPFGEFKAPALCLESETNEDKEEKLGIIVPISNKQNSPSLSK